MADDQADAAAAAATATATSGDVVKSNGKEPSQSQSQSQSQPPRKRDEGPPIEELYDLSKPIPRVERPNKTEFDANLKELSDAIETLKEERRQVQTQIDTAMNDPESKARLQTAREKMSELRNQKTALINDKKAMREQLDQVRSQSDKIAKDKKDTRSNIKFNSLQEIEAEIAKLQRQQETTTMSLNQEKRLIKEMDALQASKKYVADLHQKDAAMEGVKEQKKTIQQQLSAKDKEIDAIQVKMDKVMETIKGINDADQVKRDSLQSLFQKRDDYKKKIGALLKEKDALRDTFRVQNNAWYNYQRAVKAQKKMIYEEEKKKREEEKAAYLAKLQEEEAKKIPYEEEQALCDYLADYLERTYLTGKTAGKDDEDDGKEKQDDVVAVKDDPFAGLKPVNKKGDDEYFGKGKGKKKRVRSSKKQDALDKSRPFTLSVDTFEQFGLLTLTPPTSIEQVEKSVKELREKKEWYKQQPRGSVPTAQDIRKANEKAAAKLRQQTETNSGRGGGSGGTEGTEGGSAAEASSKKGANFSLDDFAPLAAGAAASSASSSAVNSSWGQKSPSSSSAAAAAATAATPEDTSAAADAS